MQVLWQKIYSIETWNNSYGWKATLMKILSMKIQGPGKKREINVHIVRKVLKLWKLLGACKIKSWWMWWKLCKNGKLITQCIKCDECGKEICKASVYRIIPACQCEKCPSCIDAPIAEHF